MKKVFRISGIAAGLLLAAGLGCIAGVYLWAAGGVPDFSGGLAGYRPPSATTLLTPDGRVLGCFYRGCFYRENGFLLLLDDMPEALPPAFLAAVDSGFYRHETVSVPGLFRAFLRDLSAGRNNGSGATIAGQTARLLLPPERAWRRKLKEAILLWRLDHQLTRDEILTLYLNHVSLGRNARGVRAAARAYFGKPPGELTLAECAALAALARAPAASNPCGHPERAEQRRTCVLDRLREDGRISDEAYREAASAPLVCQRSAPCGPDGDAGPLEEARRRLIGLFSGENARRLGLPAHGEDALDRLGLAVEVDMRGGMITMIAIRRGPGMDGETIAAANAMLRDTLQGG